MGITVLSIPPVQLRDINKAENIRRFEYRRCSGCGKHIMNHYRINFKDPQRRGLYYCYRDGTSYSPGLIVDSLKFN